MIIILVFLNNNYYWCRSQKDISSLSKWRSPTLKSTLRRSGTCSLQQGIAICLTTCCIWTEYKLYRNKKALKIRESKTIGPYVENLSKLAVASFKVWNTKIAVVSLVERYISITFYCWCYGTGCVCSYVNGKQISNCHSHRNECRKFSIPCNFQHYVNQDDIRLSYSGTNGNINVDIIS